LPTLAIRSTPQSTDIREEVLTMAAGRYSQLAPLAAYNEDKFHAPPGTPSIHSMVITLFTLRKDQS
jgi:hypothetical protein